MSIPQRMFAPAKINLTLHITGQRADGYHLLDSLVVFADVGDWLTVTPAAQTSLQVTGPFSVGVPVDHRNSVMQAAARVGAQHALTLEKNLPHGAGIGGGSSDAAAVLRHFNAPQEALQLGADVPVCVAAHAQRMRGIGEVLTPVDGLPKIFAVLVNPGMHVPTPQIFKALDQKNNPAMPEILPQWSDGTGLMAWLAEQRNDLQAPACQIAPEINAVLTALRHHSDLVRMSGSGATCFALFSHRSDAESAAKAVAQEHPGWWVQSCGLS